MPTPKVEILTLDQFLEMLAADDGMPVTDKVAAVDALRDAVANIPPCGDPDCEFCHPKHHGSFTPES